MQRQYHTNTMQIIQHSTNITGVHTNIHTTCTFNSEYVYCLWKTLTIWQLVNTFNDPFVHIILLGSVFWLLIWILRECLGDDTKLDCEHSHTHAHTLFYDTKLWQKLHTPLSFLITKSSELIWKGELIWHYFCGHAEFCYIEGCNQAKIKQKHWIERVQIVQKCK